MVHVSVCQQHDIHRGQSSDLDPCATLPPQQDQPLRKDRIDQNLLAADAEQERRVAQEHHAQLTLSHANRLPRLATHGVHLALPDQLAELPQLSRPGRMSSCRQFLHKHWMREPKTGFVAGPPGVKLASIWLDKAHLSTRPTREPSMPRQATAQQPVHDFDEPAAMNVNRKDHTLSLVDPERQRIWDHVASSPLHSLWDFKGTAPWTIVKRTFHAFNEDNLLSRAAELGYYFLFALFPTLFSASALLGLVARSATDIYLKLLNYLALVVPHDAMGIVLDTFNQTTAHSTGGKIGFGLAAAIWSASVGFSAIQDTLNIVYKVKETRPFWKARGSAMLVTVLLSLIVTLALVCLFAGTFLSHLVRHHIDNAQLGLAYGIAIHLVFDLFTAAMLVLLFAVIYYFAPDIKNKRWRWLYSRRRHRHRLLVPRLDRPARLSLLLQQLLGHLWLAWCGHHPAHVVLHHRPDAPARRRDQLRDRSLCRRSQAEGRRRNPEERHSDRRHLLNRLAESEPRPL